MGVPSGHAVPARNPRVASCCLGACRVATPSFFETSVSNTSRRVAVGFLRCACQVVTTSLFFEPSSVPSDDAPSRVRVREVLGCPAITNHLLPLYVGLTSAHLRNPEVRRLSQLLQSVILQDRATSTTLCYLRSAKRWTAWCESSGFSPLPAKPTAVALYLVHLMDRNLSKSSVSGAAYAISWLHRKFNVPNPVQSPLVNQTLAALQRLLARPNKKKKPLRTSQVKMLVERYGQENSTLPDLQMVTLITLGFCAFLRWDDLRRLRVSDLTFYRSHMTISLESRKNDQFRRGSLVSIARSRSATCPVELLERFIQRSNHKSNQPLFCLARKTKHGYKLRDTPLSYSRARSSFRTMIGKIDLDPTLYGLHSLRSGGATEAAAKGIRGRIWRKHGGWRSTRCADGYVQESLQKSLAVSHSLGL